MYDITLINMSDGSVAGHRTGCADIKKQSKKLFNGEPWSFKVNTKEEARAEYNADFDEEEGWYDIDWKACADHVPADDEPAPVTVGIPLPSPGVTVKKGAKWTYLYAADGSLIAELRNDQLAAIAEHLA